MSLRSQENSEDKNWRSAARVVNNQPKWMKFQGWAPNKAQRWCCCSLNKLNSFWKFALEHEEARKTVWAEIGQVLPKQSTNHQRAWGFKLRHQRRLKYCALVLSATPVYFYCLNSIIRKPTRLCWREMVELGLKYCRSTEALGVTSHDPTWFCESNIIFSTNHSKIATIPYFYT